MGWCSGTEMFDRIVYAILASDATEAQAVEIIQEVIVAFRFNDWDCEADSYYWDREHDNPVMLAWKARYPERFKD